MPNPLFNSVGSGPQGNPFGPFGNMMNFMNSFNQFRSGISGNPQQMVQNLRDSGKMSEEQFNLLSNMANQIVPFIGGRR